MNTILETNSKSICPAYAIPKGKGIIFQSSIFICFWQFHGGYMGVSKNNGTPKSSQFSWTFPLFSPSILGFFPLFVGNIHSIPLDFLGIPMFFWELHHQGLAEVFISVDPMFLQLQKLSNFLVQNTLPRKVNMANGNITI